MVEETKERTVKAREAMAVLAEVVPRAHIFPLFGKIPIAGSNGFKDAQPLDVALKADVYGKDIDNHTNWGLATGISSGVWVLDIDGDEGRKSLEEWERLNGKLPLTIKVQTRRGTHYYFRYADGINIRTGIANGIDCRGDGGYVVLPPSELPEKGDLPRWTYKWIDAGVEVADAPEWLVKLAKARLIQTHTSSPAEKIPVGQRDDYLISKAGIFWNQGIHDESALFDLLQGINKRELEVPLPDQQVSEKVRSAIRNFESLVPLTDAGLVDSIVKEHRLIKDMTTGRVFECNVFPYIDITDEKLMDFVKTTCAGLATKNVKEKGKRKLQSSGYLQSVHALLKKCIPSQKPQVPKIGEIPLPNGKMLNIADGIAENFDFCPVTYPIIPAEETPTNWIKLLDVVFEGNQDVVKYLQKLFGITIAGDNVENHWVCCYGTGANGKSTVVNTLTGILGRDFHKSIPTELLVSKRNGFTANQEYTAASLFRKRLALASEADEGRLNEAAIKMFTSRDTINARNPYGLQFDYVPSYTLWMTTNHNPQIHSQDHGTWRRILYVPFNHTLTEVEKIANVEDVLQSEYSQILGWAMEGYRLYKKEGLRIPAIIEQAQKDYRNEQDSLLQFILGFCEEDMAKAVSKEYFLRSYNKFAEDSHLPVFSMKTMASAMKQHGYSDYRRATRRYWAGIKLIKDPHKDRDNNWEYAAPNESEHINHGSQTATHPVFGVPMIPSDMLPMRTGDGTEVHVQRISLRLRQ
jgi:putative DNA primase/helicase